MTGTVQLMHFLGYFHQSVSQFVGDRDFFAVPRSVVIQKSLRHVTAEHFFKTNCLRRCLKSVTIGNLRLSVFVFHGSWTPVSLSTEKHGAAFIRHEFHRIAGSGNTQRDIFDLKSPDRQNAAPHIPDVRVMHSVMQKSAFRGENVLRPVSFKMY